MPPPRQVIPGRCYLITRRCAQRAFLLRPDAETNNAFLYCLAEAATRFDIAVLMSCAMSNHHHTVIYDRHGNYPEFLEHFHKMLARSQNVLRGRWENFWSAGQCSVVRLLDRDDVVRKLVYVAANPINDHLVDRVHHWPGVHTLRALVKGIVLEARRPAHFFRPNGPMPETAKLRVGIPPELGDERDLIAAVVAGVAHAEESAARLRAETGVRIVGRARVKEQSWRSSPESLEPRRALNPTLASAHPASRVAALADTRAFRDEYRAARQRLLARAPALFPIGTYWLRRFASVPLAEPHRVAPG